MSVRRPTARSGQPPRAVTAVTAVTAAPDANRLSQVLAAGLERKLSLGTCRPCTPNAAGRRQAAVATDRLVDYNEDTDWSRVTADRYPNGPRFAKACPDDYEGPFCDEEDKVPVDGITLHEFKRNRPIMILGCGHCFNPDSLARWVQTNRTRMCTYNDYSMTNKELAELGFTPTFQPLPSVPLTGPEIRVEDGEGNLKFYRESDDGLAMVRQEFTGGRTVYLEGPRGGEYIVLMVNSTDGTTYYFEGPASWERLVRVVELDGTTTYFEGESEEENMVKRVFPDGATNYYEGPDGEERKVRRVDSDGNTTFYEGESGEEHIVRMWYLDDTTVDYEGPSDEERKVRMVDRAGNTTYYEGEAEEERMVRRVFPDGDTVYYEGPANRERVVRRVSAEGTTIY